MAASLIKGSDSCEGTQTKEKHSATCCSRCKFLQCVNDALTIFRIWIHFLFTTNEAGVQCQTCFSCNPSHQCHKWWRQKFKLSLKKSMCPASCYNCSAWFDCFTVASLRSGLCAIFCGRLSPAPIANSWCASTSQWRFKVRDCFSSFAPSSVFVMYLHLWLIYCTGNSDKLKPIKQMTRLWQHTASTNYFYKTE